MIQPGTYRAHATKAEFGETKKGDPQVAVSFRIIDEDHPEAQGQEITWYGYFSEKTKQRTLESLVHAGWDGDDIDELQGLGTAEVSLVIIHDEYKGKVSAKVDWVNAIGGSTLQRPMDDAAKKQFAKSLKGDLAELRKKMGLGQARPAAKGARTTPFD